MAFTDLLEALGLVLSATLLGVEFLGLWVNISLSGDLSLVFVFCRAGAAPSPPFLFLTLPFSAPSTAGDNSMIPSEKLEDLVEHVVMVHQSVGEFSKQFQQKLRRSNYVTPKNYLDFINTYSKLLDEKTQYNIGERGEAGAGQGCGGGVL